mgnify:CR=1 FL=1
MNTSIEYPSDWTEYELIDSGDGGKLERFGQYRLVRPDPRALWGRLLPAEVWDSANATYWRADLKSGEWEVKFPPPSPWLVRYHKITFRLRPTEFKHVGVFPEQAVNWNWLEKIIAGRPLNILNLFAYTGGATMTALASGARVTHVDASKGALTWANENLKASKLDTKPIRWIQEDVHKFVLREEKRGNTYDGIIMDPPRFGRGSKGEVWKLENDLPKLIASCRKILAPKPAFVLVNAYTADMSALVLHNMLTSSMNDLGGSISFGELAIKESTSDRLLPNGIFARWLK